MVFSPTLKRYLAESKAMTTEGSVSDESVLKTDVLQSIECACLRGVGWKDRNGSLNNIVHGLGRHNKLASLTNALSDDERWQVVVTSVWL